MTSQNQKPKSSPFWFSGGKSEAKAARNPWRCWQSWVKLPFWMVCSVCFYVATVYWGWWDMKCIMSSWHYDAASPRESNNPRCLIRPREVNDIDAGMQKPECWFWWFWKHFIQITALLLWYNIPLRLPSITGDKGSPFSLISSTLLSPDRNWLWKRLPRF